MKRITSVLGAMALASSLASACMAQSAGRVAGSFNFPVPLSSLALGAPGEIAQPVGPLNPIPIYCPTGFSCGAGGGGGGATPTGSAGTPNAAVISVQGVSNGTPQAVSGSVSVSNLPATQPVSGSVSVSNLPATQPVSGSVSVSNLPATQAVTGSVTVSNLPATQPVSGSVTVSNLPATQPVSGSVTVSAMPAGAAGEAHLGEVGSNSFVAAASFTRPSGSTTYAAGSVINAGATSATFTPLSLTAARVNGGTGVILRVRVACSNPLAINDTFRVYFFKKTPTSTVGDGGAFAGSLNGAFASAYIGFADVTVDQQFSDGVKGVASPSGGQIIFDADTTTTSIFAVLTDKSGHQAAASEMYAVAAELDRN